MSPINYTLVEMTFGDWLLNRRKEARLTQDELARKAGVSTAYISTLERNQPHSRTGAELRPALTKVDRLAKALGADADEARLAAGYAPKHGATKPTNRRELVEALERIGVEQIEFHENIDDKSPEQLQELFEAIKFAVEYTLTKQGK